MSKQNNILKVTLVQFDIEWESTKENLSKIENMLQGRQQNSDLVLLPEMFNSGFSMRPAKIATTMQGEVVEWMKQWASDNQSVIAGSVAIVENGHYYNRFLAVYPNGNIEKYDKRHLFRMSDEEKIYSAGSQQVIVDINGWRCALFICYDIRFPVWSRNRDNYDFALYAANWPFSRIDVWKTLLKARALENQCYVAGVNRIGKSDGIDYNGQSLIYDYKGVIIGSLFEHEEGLIEAELSLKKLNDFKEKFPAWMDADRFFIEKNTVANKEG